MDRREGGRTGSITEQEEREVEREEKKRWREG